MSQDIETELKLTIDRNDVAAFRHLPFLRDKAIGPPRRRKVFSTYFDTPDLLLKDHAMALRLRKIGGKWLQALKTAGDVAGGLRQRGEWEFPSRGPEFDLALFRETPLAKLPNREKLHLALRPVFSTDFYRTTWLIETAPHQRVEVALDQGVIRSGHDEAAISEVEIELVEGGVTSLFDVAFALGEHIALRPEIASKAERGNRLFLAAQPIPCHSTDVELKRKWTLTEAMQAVTAACLLHFEANVEGAVSSDDPEYIHQMRVALRRLRSAMRVFKPANAKHLVEELRWLTGALGDARDWDVLVTESLPRLLGEYGDVELASQLMAAGHRRQSLARQAAREALASPRFGKLALKITRWVGVPGELVLSPPPVSVSDINTENEDAGASSADVAAASEPLDLKQFARREIRRCQRRLLHDAAALTELSIEARHQVRIDAKRLRYSVDFFASLFDKHRVTRYMATLREIQDVLGGSNDAAVAISLIDRLAPPERFSDFARGWFAAHTQMRLGDVERGLSDLKEIGRF